MPNHFNVLDNPPQLAYTAPALLKSWVNFGSVFAKAGYTKDAQGVVHLKGLVKDGITIDKTDIFVLPVGYRPSETRIFIVNGWDTALQSGRIDIRSNGSVEIRDTPVNTWISLDGISFVAA